MECNHARLLLIFARNSSELDAAEAQALRGHIDHCAECEAWTQAEKHVDETLGRAMRAVPVPADLKSRLLARLQNDQSRRRWRRGLVGAALAAALLLAVGLGWHFWLGAIPQVDLADVDRQISDKVAASPERVEEWFRDQGLPIEAPRRFNYGYLYSYDTAHFLNRRVPKLLFVHRDQPAIAEVYVFSEHQFNLENLKNELPRANSNHSIQALREDSLPGFLYLAVFTGGSLESFMNPQHGLQ